MIVVKEAQSLENMEDGKDGDINVAPKMTYLQLLEMKVSPKYVLHHGDRVDGVAGDVNVGHTKMSYLLLLLNISPKEAMSQGDMVNGLAWEVSAIQPTTILEHICDSLEGNNGRSKRSAKPWGYGGWVGWGR